MANVINNLYEFGGFRFDAANKTLWRGEKMIALPPKATEVLFLLIGAEGKIVSKKEILNCVWADTFVEEGVLTQSIYQLRQALAAEDAETQYIENIARRGYRLAVPLKEIYASENTVFVPDQRAEYLAHIYQPEKNPDITGARQHSAKIYNLSTDSNTSAFSESQKTSNAFGEIPKPENHFFWAWILAVMVLIGAGLGVYQFAFRATEKSTTNIAPIEQLKFQRLTDLGNVIFPTISPDGKMLAYILHEDQQESVWIKQIETESSIQILPPSRRGYGSPVFSPDGKYLFYREFAEGGSIFQIPILGGNPKKVADNVWSGFSISKDGRQLAFFRRDQAKKAFVLIVSNLDGGGERELRERKFPHDYRGVAAFSPDGSKITVSGGMQRQNNPSLFTVNVETGEETELKTPKWRSIAHTLWMPNGKDMIISARQADEPNSQIWMLDTETSEIRRLTNDLESYFWMSLSADGSRLIVRQQRIISHLWLLPEGDLNKARQLTSGVRNFDGYIGLTWTPDGKIIYSVRSGSTTNIYSMKIDGTEQTQLTENAGLDNTDPIVSNDGRYIVFTSNRSGTQQIWRMEADGHNQTQMTFGENDYEIAHSPDISPDGREVYFIKGGKSAASIWKMPIEGGDAVKVSDQTQTLTEYFLAVSPDGQRIAFRQMSDGAENQSEEPTIKIGVMSSDGKTLEKSFDLPMRRALIQWTDNEKFDYFAGTFNSSTLMRLSMQDGKTEKLIDFPDRVHNFAWSKDGKNLVVSRGKLQGDAILISNLPQ